MVLDERLLLDESTPSKQSDCKEEVLVKSGRRCANRFYFFSKTIASMTAMAVILTMSSTELSKSVK